MYINFTGYNMYINLTGYNMYTNFTGYNMYINFERLDTLEMYQFIFEWI